MAKIPHADDGQTCPFNGQDTSVTCHKCPMWLQLRGTNPNTGEPVDDWRCSFAWLPMLLIENSLMQRQTGAAVESFRNETVKANEVACRVIAATAPVLRPQALLEG
jgi:hypothetical protein